MAFNVSEAEEELLIRALKIGSDLNTSALFAGIQIDELLKFLDEADSGKKTVAAKKASILLTEIKKARAGSILEAQAQIKHAFSEDWKAAAWYLERTLPEIYGKNRGE